MSWRARSDGREVDPGAYDGTVWLWELVSEDGAEERGVRVKISGTAMALRDVHPRVADARTSKGETEISGVLDWVEPPEEIEFVSTSSAPSYKGGDPGPESKEVGEIGNWFDERGITMMFTGRGVGVGPNPPPIQTWTANLLDLDRDELLYRAETPSRLEAARKAKAWWQEHEERPHRTVAIGTAPETDIALPITPIGGTVPKPEISREQAVRLRRHRLHLVWTGPDPDDPDSCWMIEVFNQDERLIGIAIQPEAQDALSTVLEDLVPPGEPV